MTTDNVRHVKARIRRAAEECDQLRKGDLTVDAYREWWRGITEFLREAMPGQGDRFIRVHLPKDEARIDYIASPGGRGISALADLMKSHAPRLEELADSVTEQDIDPEIAGVKP